MLSTNLKDRRLHVIDSSRSAGAGCSWGIRGEGGGGFGADGLQRRVRGWRAGARGDRVLVARSARKQAKPLVALFCQYLWELVLMKHQLRAAGYPGAAFECWSICFIRQSLLRSGCLRGGIWGIRCSGGDFSRKTVVRIDVWILSHFGHFEEFAELREGARLLEKEIEAVLVLLALCPGCITICTQRSCLFWLLFFYSDNLSSPWSFLFFLCLFITWKSIKNIYISSQRKGTKNNQISVLYIKSERLVLFCTFNTLHAFHKDATTLWKDPVTSLVAVLSDRHGAQWLWRVK